MSNRDWKPGDLGVTAKGRLALRRENNPDGWIDSHGAPWSTDRFPDNVRPLVVIDPEDWDQVDRLLNALAAKQDFMPVDAAQEALREFANPPKPEEPQGLGAVVEDVNGDLWVRCDLSEDEPWTRHADDSMTVFAYREIKAVKVHAAGWSR